MKTTIISILILIFLAPTQKKDTIYLLFDGTDSLCKKVNKNGVENYFFYNDSLINIKKNYLIKEKLIPQGFCEYYQFTKSNKSSDTITNKEFNNLIILNRFSLLKENINFYQKKVLIVERGINNNYIVSKAYFSPCE